MRKVQFTFEFGIGTTTDKPDSEKKEKILNKAVPITVCVTFLTVLILKTFGVW